jgi:ATP-dependent helicase Lhr and Lhr-like helicase
LAFRGGFLLHRRWQLLFAESDVRARSGPKRPRRPSLLELRRRAFRWLWMTPLLHPDWRRGRRTIRLRGQEFRSAARSPARSRRVRSLQHGRAGAGVRTFVSHGSLSPDERRQAEAAFVAEPDCAIVATSTLELGIDVGDLDHVIQVGAPPSVASFLQRMGRTGRRAGSIRNFLFLATSESELLLALGIARLWREGYVEHVEPPSKPAHIYAQQVMALALQESGIAISDLQSWLGATFEALSTNESAEIIDHMAATGMLHSDRGVLGLGARAEREFGRRHFGDLVVSFASPMLLSVFFGRTELGAVHPLAVTTSRDEEPIIILMAGRTWRVADVDWPRRRVSVVAAEGQGRARWMGSGRPASFAVCRAAEAVVAGAAPGCGLSRRATSKLEELQEQLPFVHGTRIPIVHSGQDTSYIWTFAGGLTNAALAQVIPGTRARSDDFCIRIKAGSERAAIDAFWRWDEVSFRPSVSSEMIKELKFNTCLSERMAISTIQARLLDRDGIQQTLSRTPQMLHFAQEAVTASRAPNDDPGS